MTKPGWSEQSAGEIRAIAANEQSRPTAASAAVREAMRCVGRTSEFMLSSTDASHQTYGATAIRPTYRRYLRIADARVTPLSNRFNAQFAV